MTEKTRERLLNVIEKEFPGCTIELNPHDSLLTIIQDGKVLSKYPPLMRFAHFDDLTDDQLRLIVLGVCGQIEESPSREGRDLEATEVLNIIKRRRDALKNSSTNTDTSEVLTTRAEMNRLLADEYGDLLKEIEGATPGSLNP